MKLEGYTRIDRKMQEKDMNIETQNYIMDYIYINQKLFGKFLNINEVEDRILNNLNYNIINGINIKGNLLEELLFTTFLGGGWNPYINKIRMNPKIKLKSILFKEKKQKYDSIVRHELDHVATTKYVNITEQEKEQLIQSYLERNKIQNPKIEKRVRNFVNRQCDGKNGKLAIVGIEDLRQVMQNDISLRKLNEGITVYKQEMYDKFLGNNSYVGDYRIERDVAKFIADVIGKEELVSMHSNNDYGAIRTAFYEKTGKELNELVNELNKKSRIKTMLFGRKYTRYFSKKMEKCIEDIGWKKDKNEKTDFVPKFDIDYTTVFNENTMLFVENDLTVYNNKDKIEEEGKNI